MSAIFARHLDRRDFTILRLLQEDAGRSQREIAEAANLSAPAVQRRIAKLEQQGFIKQKVAVLDPAGMGYPITVLVEITLRDDRSATVSAAKSFFREATEVQQCYCVTGTAGFVLILLVPTMEDYEQRTARLFADNELVRSYRSIVVLDRVKVGLSVPI